MHPKDANGTANSVDPALFAQVYLSKNLGSLWYLHSGTDFIVLLCIRWGFRWYTSFQLHQPRGHLRQVRRLDYIFYCTLTLKISFLIDSHIVMYITYIHPKGEFIYCNRINTSSLINAPSLFLWEKNVKMPSKHLVFRSNFLWGKFPLRNVVLGVLNCNAPRVSIWINTVSAGIALVQCCVAMTA